MLGMGVTDIVAAKKPKILKSNSVRAERAIPPVTTTSASSVWGENCCLRRIHDSAAEATRQKTTGRERERE